MVRAIGLEPMASCKSSRRSSQLSYARGKSLCVLAIQDGNVKKKLLDFIFKIYTFPAHINRSTMPIIKSAIKRVRQSDKRRQRNLITQRNYKTLVKEFETLIEAGKTAEAQKLFPEVQKSLDLAAKNNILHKNNVGRKKSRLSKLMGGKKVAKAPAKKEVAEKVVEKKEVKKEEKVEEKK